MGNLMNLKELNLRNNFLESLLELMGYLMNLKKIIST